MSDIFKDLEQNFFIFYRKMENYKKNMLGKNNLDELSNPEILLILKGDKSNNGTPQKEIVTRCGVSAPTITISIKRMEAKGLLTRTANDSSRENYIKLTPKGNELMEKFSEHAELIRKQILNGFTKDEVKQMNNFALKMTKNISELIDKEK